MALAAAAIKAHFKGDGQVAPPALGGPSAKAQRMFRASNAAVYGPSEDVGVADASGGTEVKDEAAKRRDFSRQSLDRQLMGVESVLQMQQSGKDDDEGSEKAGGGSKSMGMKEKQAMLNAMFVARKSIASPAAKREDSRSGDEDDDDDTLSDVSDRGEDKGETTEPEQVVMDVQVGVEEIEEDDDPGLPSVPDQRVLAIVNSFVVNATKLINRVCLLAEKDLADVDRGIHKLEVTLSLLERKLKSVDGLEPGQQPAASPRGGDARAAAVETTPSEGGGAQGEGSVGAVEAGQAVSGESASETAENSNLVKASEHPVYSRFFRMLRMGVVELAVKQKMQAEGLNTSIIDKGPETMLEP